MSIVESCADRHSEQAALEVRRAKAMASLLRHPARHAHASWLPDWATSQTPAMPERLEQELSAWLKSEHGLAELTEHALDLPALRVFLIEAADLLRLAQLLGMARHRTSLRQVVLQPQVEFLRFALGETLSVLWSPLCDAVEPCAQRLAWRSVPDEAPILCRQLQLEGQRLLLALFGERSEDQRTAARWAALRLPREVWSPGRQPLPAPQARLLEEAIVKHVVPTWMPQWTWLF